jgi:hypothetical protein
MEMKIKAIVALGCALMAVATVALAADIGEPEVVPQAINIEAVLIEERCLSGDVVEVTLSGTGNSSSPPEFAWDFTNNGSIDTGALTNPRIVTTYTDEVNITAELFARNAEGQMDSDTITFATLNCQSAE